MSILKDSGKAFDKIQQRSMIKDIKKIGCRRSISKHNQGNR